MAKPHLRSIDGCGAARRSSDGWDPDGEAAPAKQVQSQHGQVVPLMAAAIVLAAALALAVAQLGVRAVERARAQDAADAAALAAAGVGPVPEQRALAAHLAAANHAELRSMRRVGTVVVVEVQVGSYRAEAAATWAVGEPGTRGDRPGP